MEIKNIIHCLIVDDEENITFVIKDSLISLSNGENDNVIKYYRANSALEAIKIMRKIDISIFILDYNLGGDGENATIIIDNIDNIDNKLTFLISGEGSDDLAPVVSLYEKIDFLSKPLRNVELVSISKKIKKYANKILNEKVLNYYTEKKDILSQSKQSLENDIEKLLSVHSNIIKIESRIKEYDSFYRKLKNNNFEIDSINDLYGLRIICYYLSDIDVITETLKAELNVHIVKEKIEDKSFGYRSRHLIVTMKDKWCEIPRYNNMKNIIFEIQIRTVVMHAWAAISHNLFYKKENESLQLNRKLQRLSALLEEVDLSFDDMI